MTISVTITGAVLSVDISSTSWTVSAATGTYVDSTEIDVINNSGGLTETYEVMASTENNNWTLGTTLTDVGPDKCVLACVIKGDGVGSPSFANDDVVGFSYVTCTSAQFTDDATTNGTNVAAGEVRGMWLRLYTPTSVTATSEDITLYIRAISP
jgi:hypothetical protein